MRDINMDEFLKAYNLWIKIIHKIQQDRLKMKNSQQRKCETMMKYRRWRDVWYNRQH